MRNGAELTLSLRELLLTVFCFIVPPYVRFYANRGLHRLNGE